MIRPAILVGVLAALPSVSLAQGLSLDGDVTLGYQFNSIGIGAGLDADLNGFSIDFDGDVNFSENFAVGLGFNFNTGDIEVGGGSANIDLISLEVEPYYMHESGAFVGAYYRMSDLDLALVGPVTLGVDIQQVGIFGGYDFGQGHVEVFYGQTSIDQDALLPIPIDPDIRDYGISGSYQVMPELELYAAILRSEQDDADITLTSYSLGADYDVGNGIGIYGAVGGSTIDLGLPDNFTAMGLTLGASYDLSTQGVPIVLSAEYSRTVLDSDLLPAGLEPEIDRFALGLTIPLGNGSGDPLNSNTRTARGDYRSAAAAILNSF